MEKLKDFESTISKLRGMSDEEIASKLSGLFEGRDIKGVVESIEYYADIRDAVKREKVVISLCDTMVPKCTFKLGDILWREVEHIPFNGFILTTCRDELVTVVKTSRDHYDTVSILVTVVQDNDELPFAFCVHEDDKEGFMDARYQHWGEVLSAVMVMASLAGNNHPEVGNIINEIVTKRKSTKRKIAPVWSEMYIRPLIGKHSQTHSSDGRDLMNYRPHVRRAHWHGYRIGEGREQLIRKWLAPIVVGAKEAASVSCVIL